MNLPPCPNFTEGNCPKNDVHIERETDTAFTFRCHTCGCVNVWPKSKAEDAGRYEAGLKKIAAREAQESYERSRPAFSFGGK